MKQEQECIFCDFVQKKKNHHRDKYPFQILHEMKHSISFLSIDFPATEDGPVLVIPKKHFESLEDIPPTIQSDLIKHVSLISQALRIKNDGNNVLLNNGKAAGQFVFHTHFHIIPRNAKDNIKIEVWKRKNLSTDGFKKLHIKIQKEIKKVL